jgi:iron complex outermembrane receptor protein
VLVTARGNNLFNKAYAQWADIYYPSELMLGPPRYWELGLYIKL